MVGRQFDETKDFWYARLLYQKMFWPVCIIDGTLEQPCRSQTLTCLIQRGFQGTGGWVGGWGGGGAYIWFNVRLLFASAVQTLLRNTWEEKHQRGKQHATRRHHGLDNPWAGSWSTAAAHAVLMVLAWHLVVRKYPGKNHLSQAAPQGTPQP